MRKHWVILTALVAIASALLTVVFFTVPLVPVAASQQAKPVDSLLKVMFSIGGAIFALVVIVLLYSVVVFRCRPGDTSDGPPLEGHKALETMWTLVPLAIVISLATWGGIELRDMLRPPAEMELVVKVDSFQWGWRFEYPQYGFSSPMLALPADRPVLFRLTSRDVIHSFWIPEFRLKQDSVPGRETYLRITPTRPGDYGLRCAELCGRAHWAMQAQVKVVDADAFQRWAEGMRR